MKEIESTFEKTLYSDLYLAKSSTSEVVRNTADHGELGFVCFLKIKWFLTISVQCQTKWPSSLSVYGAQRIIQHFFYTLTYTRTDIHALSGTHVYTDVGA
jgi:hypothetical protein